MALRIIQSGNALPVSFVVDPIAEFEPGMIGQLYTRGNNIVCGVSDGSAPIGIIDDYKTRAFTAPSINEIVSTPVHDAVERGGQLFSRYDIVVPLDNPNIIPSSFMTAPVDVVLQARNGNIIFVANTQLNFDADGDGIKDSIRTVVNYVYQIPNVPGDDSTAGSGKITILFQRGIYSTDMFETNQRYAVNGLLYVSENGKLTSFRPNENYPSVAITTGPPSAKIGELEFMWL